MVRLIWKILIFLVLMLIVLSFIFFYFYKIGGDDLPASRYSNSISFNEKIDFMKTKDISKIEYISIGSSMTLNNIDSEIIVDHLGSNYINLGSWGFKISNSSEFLEKMTDFFPDLKAVIISASFVDFTTGTWSAEVNYSLLRADLKYGLDILSYFLSPDLKYLRDNSRSNNKLKKKKNMYSSLAFDEYGGCILDIDSDKINNERWVNDISKFNIDESELRSLEILLKFLRKKNIQAVFAIPPQRRGMINDTNIITINEKIKKIQTVVEENSGIFVNSFGFGAWDDSLFVDYAHLNKTGAARFTDSLIWKSKLFLP